MASPFVLTFVRWPRRRVVEAAEGEEGEGGVELAGGADHAG